MFSWLPGIAGPPRKKQLQEILDKLLSQRECSGGGDQPFGLKEKELKRLCTSAREVFLKEPSLLELHTAAAQVVVVGDLHGQFEDLQRIFERLGPPGSDGKVWVFLGDYVDRGPQGLEIVATLLAFKLRYPSQVFLLRGNHECSEITVLFGFCSECQRRSTLAAWEAVMQVFDALPLAAVLNKKVFLCHGGISPKMTTPQDVNSIRRPLDVSPSTEGLLCDLLWADPSPHVSGWCPNPRGVSYVFGLDAAQAWLRANDLRAIVRAHMVQQGGYEVLGNNEVMTVFSAADYRESANTGAVLVIDPTLDFEFVTFAPTRPLAPEEIAHREDWSVGRASIDIFGTMAALRANGGMAAVSVPGAPTHRSPFAAAAESPAESASVEAEGTGAPAEHPAEQEGAEDSGATRKTKTGARKLAHEFADSLALGALTAPVLKGSSSSSHAVPQVPAQA